MTPLERLAFDLYQVAGTENPAKIQARFLALLEAYDRPNFEAREYMAALLADVVSKARPTKRSTREQAFVGKRLLDRCRAALRGEE